MEAPCEYSLLPPLDCSLYNKTGDLVLLLCAGSVYQLEVRNRGDVRTRKSASLDGMRAAIFTVHSQLFVMFLTPGPALVSVV